jgi:predicted transcriptional regulator
MHMLDRINIMLIILESAKYSAYDAMKKMTTTNKMYKALFDTPQLEVYWEVLTQEGLLSYNPDTERFKITEKGLIFLKTYKNMDYDMRGGYNNNMTDTFEYNVY